MDEQQQPDEQKRRKLGKGCLVAVAVVFGISLLNGLLSDTEAPATEAGAVEGIASTDNETLPSLRIWNSQIMEAYSDCDTQMAALGEGLQAMRNGSGSMFESYDTANQTAETCEASASAIRNIDEPAGLDDETQEALEDAQSFCGTAIYSKVRAAEAAARFFDGDVRPSVAAEMRDLVAEGNNGALACISKIMTVATTAGVDPEEMLGTAAPAGE